MTITEWPARQPRVYFAAFVCSQRSLRYRYRRVREGDAKNRKDFCASVGVPANGSLAQ